MDQALDTQATAYLHSVAVFLEGRLWWSWLLVVHITVRLELGVHIGGFWGDRHTLSVLPLSRNALKLIVQTRSMNW